MAAGREALSGSNAASGASGTPSAKAPRADTRDAPGTRTTSPSGGAQGRAIIEGVAPMVDAGRFPIKRCAGEEVRVEADIFTDGHDVLRCLLLHRRRGEASWQEVDMAPLGNDRWRATFRVADIGQYEYTLTAWPDPLLSWKHDLQRWTQPDDIAVALATGAQLIAGLAQRVPHEEGRLLKAWGVELAGPAPLEERRARALDAELHALAARHADRAGATRHEPALRVSVEPRLAGFSAWYEMFPRSAGTGHNHGTFRDCIARLPHIADLGFDILYLPPIHPIGTTKRKGANNALSARPGEPGSPWAIGSAEGGHKAIHPELGTLADFRALLEAARSRGIEVALDIAFQCSPDHPYVREHPEWFRHRPDGSVQFAENPPKKYEDIYPFDFDTDFNNQARDALWRELKSIFDYWIEQGVKVFRVDNPHTKPLPMWEWMLGEIKGARPDIVFLSEAFTRPRPMHRLAKLGFTQSYTYFPWRSHKAELIEYFTELSQSPSREYFRPNAWPNTPDILTESLQHGGRPAFMSRLVLAATLSANYGIYGPAFELTENVARNPGSEEYLNSEKYEIRDWKLDSPASLSSLIARINRIRRDNPALQHDWGLHFHGTDNDQLICYSKSTPDHANVILTVVNLDPRHSHSGWVQLDMGVLGMEHPQAYVAHDLLTDARYHWQGERNYVLLDPGILPAHVLRLERHGNDGPDGAPQ